MGSIKPKLVPIPSIVAADDSAAPAISAARDPHKQEIDALQAAAPAPQTVTRKRKNVALAHDVLASVSRSGIYKRGVVYYYGSQVLKSNRAEATRLNATFCQVRGLPGRCIFNPTWAQHTAMTETHGYTEA